jgi:hypothetical protein
MFGKYRREVAACMYFYSNVILSIKITAPSQLPSVASQVSFATVDDDETMRSSPKKGNFLR